MYYFDCAWASCTFTSPTVVPLKCCFQSILKCFAYLAAGSSVSAQLPLGALCLCPLSTIPGYCDRTCLNFQRFSLRSVSFLTSCRWRWTCRGTIARWNMLWTPSTSFSWIMGQFSEVVRDPQHERHQKMKNRVSAVEIWPSWCFPFLSLWQGILFRKYYYPNRSPSIMLLHTHGWNYLSQSMQVWYGICSSLLSYCSPVTLFLVLHGFCFPPNVFPQFAPGVSQMAWSSCLLGPFLERSWDTGSSNIWHCRGTRFCPRGEPSQRARIPLILDLSMEGRNG